MNKLGKRIAGIILAAGVSISVLAGTGVTAYAYTQTTGTVTSDNVKVRSSASTTASQVSSLKNGDTVDIVDEATDASGYVWYKIYVNKSEFGYVRSDLVSKAGGSSSSSSSTATSTPAATSLPDTQVSAVEQKNASVIADSCNVRKGAGTGYDSAGKVTKGETVTITGEASGTDGKTWYQVTFGASGKTGFLRGDLVEIVESAPAENTENTDGENTQENSDGEATSESDQEQQQTSTTPDTSTGDGAYSLVYTADDEGNSVWYLYDNQGGYRVKVKELIEAAHSVDAVNKLRKSADTYKKIAIILGILAVLLVAGIVILVLKLRDSLYYEDEEDEYDRYSEDRRPVREAKEKAPSRRTPERDDEEGERPVRRPVSDERTVRPVRRNAEEEHDDRPLRRPERQERQERPERPAKQERQSNSREESRGFGRRNAEEEEDDRPMRRPVRESDDRSRRRPSEDRRRPEPERESASKRRARNFVGDDDDFEFEFLDLDDN